MSSKAARSLLLHLVFVLVGCGRIGFDPDPFGRPEVGFFDGGPAVPMDAGAAVRMDTGATLGPAAVCEGSCSCPDDCACEGDSSCAVFCTSTCSVSCEADECQVYCPPRVSCSMTRDRPPAGTDRSPGGSRLTLLQRSQAGSRVGAAAVAACTGVCACPAGCTELAGVGVAECDAPGCALACPLGARCVLGCPGRVGAGECALECGAQTCVANASEHITCAEDGACAVSDGWAY